MAWRKQDNHREETKVTHGRGTAWGWLHINIGSPKERNGIKPAPFDYQYTEEESELHRKVLKIAQETTGRHGEYDGEIVILAQ